LPPLSSRSQCSFGRRPARTRRPADDRLGDSHRDRRAASYSDSAGPRAAAVSLLAALAFASVLALGAGLRLSGIEAEQPVL
jgi:hypothetical protein